MKLNEEQSNLILATQIIENSLKELNLKLILRQINDKVMIALRNIETKEDYFVAGENNNYKIIKLPKE